MAKDAICIIFVGPEPLKISKLRNVWFSQGFGYFGRVQEQKLGGGAACLVWLRLNSDLAPNVWFYLGFDYFGEVQEKSWRRGRRIVGLR